MQFICTNYFSIRSYGRSFYTSNISLLMLGGAAAMVALLFSLNRAGVTRLLPYLLTGGVLWFFMLQSGVHATVAGILLAFFIPLLIGTGGNSGTQISSTLVRSMALGEVRLRDMGRVIRKEVSTSFLIALTLGLAGCLRAWMMGIGMEITLIVSLTLVCITLWSAVVSSVIPMVLKRIGIDPAVVSAPFIATLIDGTGLIIYFKIAS